MSRGLGKMQKHLLRMIRLNRKPMTFDDIRAVILQGAPPNITKLHVSPERSLRRALHSLARDKFLVVAGDGGPGDPFRYSIHPFFIGIITGTDAKEGRELQEAMEVAFTGFEGRCQM